MLYSRAKCISAEGSSLIADTIVKKNVTSALDAEDHDLVANTDKTATAVNEDAAVHSSLSSKELPVDLPTNDIAAEDLSARISETFADAGAGEHLYLNR